MRTAQEKLGELFDLKKGRKAASVLFSQETGTRPYLQIDNVRGADPTQFTLDKMGTEVCPDDLVIVWDGANAGTVGYGIEGMIGSTLTMLRPRNGQRIFTPYVGRFLQSQFQALNRATTGATIPHVDRRFLESVIIPLPPLEEQRRIAAILDKADALRRKRAEALRLTDQLLQALFVHIVGPLAPDYRHWGDACVEQLAAETPGAIRTGPFGSDLKHSEFTTEGIAVLGIDNAVQNRFCWAQRRYVTAEKYEKLQRYTVYPKDVIVTIMGTTGRSAVVPEEIPPAISTKHLVTITVNNAMAFPEFLSFCFHSHPDVLRQIDAANKGAIMSGLNLGTIKGLRIKVPPLHVQNAFVRCHQKTEEARERITEHLVQAQESFDGLAQRAFRGDL